MLPTLKSKLTKHTLGIANEYMIILVIHRLSVGGFKKGLAEKRRGSYSYLQVSMLLFMVESSRGKHFAVLHHGIDPE